jgi:CHAT domain-containing protein
VTSLLKPRGWSAAAYTKELALKSAVLKAPHPRVPHLATHGLFSARSRFRSSVAAGDLRAAALREIRCRLYFMRASPAPCACNLATGAMAAAV